MRLVMKNVTKHGQYYKLHGSSQLFNSINEIATFVRNSEKAKKQGKSKKVDGRRFWSERLQIPFRSNWEIDLAEMLTDLDIRFEYEPKRFYFRGEGESYLPDFYLPDYNVWIEVKGYMDKRSLRRVKLFKKYHGADSGFFLWEKEERELTLKTPELLRTYIEIAQGELERRQK